MAWISCGSTIAAKDRIWAIKFSRTLKIPMQIPVAKGLEDSVHDPAISVFIAFIKLYSYAQDSANTFTQRHLDFYYEEILKTQIRRVPETAVVNFEVVDGSGPVEIEAGRQFSCGKDEDLNSILFQSEETILVTDAQIASIHTLRFSREDMIAPECYLGFVTRLQCSDIPIDNDSGDHGLKRASQYLVVFQIICRVTPRCTAMRR